MRALLSFADQLEKYTQIAGKLGSWAIIPLVGIIMFDVVTRKFQWIQQAIMETPLYDYMSPTKMQEMEWHLHGIIFMMCLGYTYTMNAHVRVDLVREKLSDRKQAWLELIGILVLMLPYVILVFYFCTIFVELAYTSNEASDATTGLGRRWIIKSFFLIGLFFAFTSGIATLIRQCVYLFGPEELQPEVKMNMLTSAVAEHLPHIEDEDIDNDIDKLDGHYDEPEIVRGG